MGDNDNGDNKLDESDSSTWDFGGEETQIFDTQFCDSPTSSVGNKCDGDTDQLHTQQNTIPYDDELATQLMDHDGETELDNLSGETQVVTLGDETQVMNFDAELEVMDMFDSDEKNETQLFNDFDTEEVVDNDHEGTEKTEVVDDSDEFSDEDSGRRDLSNPRALDHAQHIHQCQEDRKESYSKSDCGRSEQHASGVGVKTFTSIRAASMRASGLAALKKSYQRSKSPSCPTLSSEPDIEHRTLFRKSQSDAHEKHKLIEGPETGNRRGFGRSTARKLFVEDEIAEAKETNDNIDPPGEAEFAGLSYIDSQEPGDASQANALDFVDNFLKVNIEHDDECDISKSTVRKSKPLLSAKGTQTFAKSTNLINAVDKVRIFDWDNNSEDEAQFFRKYKGTFFASGGQRLKSSVPSRSGKKLGQSDSKLVLDKSKENAKPRKSLGTHIKDVALRKNLISELDKQSTDMPGGKDIHETAEVRFDTQMAAEAMEDLCVGLQETAHGSTKAGGVCNRPEGSHKSRPLLYSNVGVRTTRSNSKRSDVQSKGVKRSRAAAKKSVVGNEAQNLDNMLFDVEKKRENISVNRRKGDVVDAQVAPRDQMPVKRQCIPNVTPARRTRQSMKDNVSDNALDTLTGFYPKGKRTRQKLSSTRKEVGIQSISRLTRSKAAILSEQENGLIKGRFGQNLSVCTTPVSRGTPIKDASPICMGDEYLKQSCRRPSLIQEVCSLLPTGSLITSPHTDTRHRRDVSLIRVLFSRHLDGDIIKQQKKILSRLGASESSLMSDATHFIADDFVRTRNMLEAIALGKPVVTHLWLESCGQACCHIDEKNFILRDAKKEKEFGFSLPSSLAHARQNPLLKGHRVFITRNTKPGKEILSSLVKAVHGVAIERMGRSSLNDVNVHDGLLILSCEEDYSVCLPFLEKGAAVYSSELLLNGIVTQRLEYQRHRLFLDHVKRTRSTLWLKKDDQYKPVGKVK